MATVPLTALPLRHRSEPCCGVVEPPALSASETNRLASKLKAAGDETRLGILALLASQPGPCCVCDITEKFDQAQPTISHHLRILREAGLIDTVKRGLWAFYWVTDEGRSILELSKAVQ